MRMLKFFVIWGSGVLVLRYIAFGYMSQLMKMRDPADLAVIIFLTLLVWTITSAVLAISRDK